MFFFFNDPATPEIYPLSLHDALPISLLSANPRARAPSEQHFDCLRPPGWHSRRRHRPGRSSRHLRYDRSEEHTSELQSQSNLVCRLLLEKKKNTILLVAHLLTHSTL